MKKNRFAPKTVHKTFTLSTADVSKMDEMIRRNEKFGFLTYSEIIRRGIHLAYRENIPAYKDPTPAGKMKEKELDDIRDIEERDPKEYALSLGAEILSMSDGRECAVFHSLGTANIEIVPLDDLKETLERDPAILSLHSTTLQNRWSVQYVLDNYYLQHNDGSLHNRVEMYNKQPIIFPGFDQEADRKLLSPKNSSPEEFINQQDRDINRLIDEKISGKPINV